MTSRLTTPPRRSRSLAALGMVLALALLAACGGQEVAGGPLGPGSPPGTGGSGGGGGGGGTGATDSSAIVGRWSRVVYFYDDLGSLNSSETVWTFAADGGAARAVFTSNLSLGISDATVSLARWRIESGAVVISYQLPDSGTVRFAYRFETSVLGRVLVLGDIAFSRVTG